MYDILPQNIPIFLHTEGLIKTEVTSTLSLCQDLDNKNAYMSGASLEKVPWVPRNPQNFEIYLMEPALRWTRY